MLNVLCLSWAAVLCDAAALSQMTLPAEGTRAGLDVPHFPSRVHAFVWRNWQCYPPERLGEVIGATAAQVRDIGHSMGLPDWPVMDAQQQRRNYISVIRRNWHLLNYEQLLRLLDWTPEQLAHALREDDFLWHKLGDFKPACPPIRYEQAKSSEPRVRQIAAVVRPAIEGLPMVVPRFGFVEELSRSGSEPPARPAGGEQERPLRFLYSYCAVFGDPLLNPDLDPYPEGLMQQLAASGVNGLWLHVVLRDLAPSAEFPEFGKDHERRLENLRAMVARAARHGIRIYLYMNEPRAMPEAFFARRPEMRGVQEKEFVAMCTSAAPVREWISSALTHVFKSVPGLGGVFTITASENLTNCCSHFQQAKCPRCSKRPLAEVIAEVSVAIAQGVRRGAPDAKVITWDWGWPNDAAADIIRQLPDGVVLMSVSEWDQPFTRGGVESRVGEYSISVVGPGPRARRHWELARARGLQTVAKMQVNCTWEISAVPWLPTMNLIAEHCAGLRAEKVDGQMLSWTLGGYPSPNLRLVQKVFDEPALTPEQALEAVARERYGDTAILPAWTAFSEAFTAFPYSVAILYVGPQQLGPANLLFAEPTGFTATMVGFPYDDLRNWRGPFPEQVLAEQFDKIVAGWKEGLAKYAAVLQSEPKDRHLRANLEADLIPARAAGIHFASTANQIRFIMARSERLDAKSNPQQKAAATRRMHELIKAETQLARELLGLIAQDSRIGFEATNHYYYLPTDLLEKIVSCEWLLRTVE